MTGDRRRGAQARRRGAVHAARGAAADDTPMLPVLQHASARCAAGGFAADAVVLLQPTSPLRRAEHIDAAVDLLETSGADSVVSGRRGPHQFNPVSVMRLDGGSAAAVHRRPAVTRRQDKPRVFARNGPAVLAVRAVLEPGSLYGDDCPRCVMMSAAIRSTSTVQRRLAEFAL